MTPEWVTDYETGQKKKVNIREYFQSQNIFSSLFSPMPLTSLLLLSLLLPLSSFLHISLAFSLSSLKHCLIFLTLSPPLSNSFLLVTFVSFPILNLHFDYTLKKEERLSLMIIIIIEACIFE